MSKEGNNIRSSFSWEIHSDTVAVKILDKSAFLHHGTGIPKDLRSYFRIDGIFSEQKIPVTLVHLGKSYDAYYAKTPSNRTRLFWSSEFADLIRSIFPVAYDFHSKNRSIREKTQFMRLQRSSPDDYVYRVDFFDAEQIEEDVKRELEVEYEPRTEGVQKVYLSRRYERNSANRRRAIEIHGLNCVMCGFNFEKVYGEIGRGFIEVHHVKPLSEIDQAYIVDPKTDLITVCSNCHRMIHRDSLKSIKKNLLDRII